MAQATVTRQALYNSVVAAIAAGTSFVRARSPFDIANSGAEWGDDSFTVTITATPVLHSGTARYGSPSGPIEMRFAIRVQAIQRIDGDPSNENSTLYSGFDAIWTTMFGSFGPAGTDSLVTGDQIQPIEPTSMPEPRLMPGTSDWMMIDHTFNCGGFVAQS